MPEFARVQGVELPLLEEESLCEWISAQRWYASKSRSISSASVVESIPLRDDPLLVLALVQTRFATGTHELYQLLSSETEPDAMRSDPTAAAELLARIVAGEEIDTDEGHFSFQTVAEFRDVDEGSSVRVLGGEQSNSSVVYDERIVLKVIRKLEPGINPELEILRFLTARDFEHIAALEGWYAYDGQALAATLGVAQTFIADAVDGWELALDEIARDPERFLQRLGDLGRVTAELHNALASDSGDPAFSPEEPSNEAISLLTASVDEDIERIFVRLPDKEALAPIIGRGQDVRERLAARAQVGSSGRVIRTHGDYHLGQTLSTPRGWVIIDFEGEPARPLSERRQKRSPLRDVAGMLRSFAYAASAVELQRGQRAPDDFELRAREQFLSNYFEHIDASLMPAGEAQVANLLSIFELEKAIYELQYELNSRPDWVAIPVAGIRRLLEEETTTT
jgi:trehalose synthase-fused probable maltokinase